MSSPEEEVRSPAGHPPVVSLSPDDSTPPDSASASSLLPSSTADGPAPQSPFYWSNFRPLSPDVPDRIFPIRSVVNIEPQLAGSESSETGSSASYHSSVSHHSSAAGTPIIDDSIFQGGTQLKSGSATPSTSDFVNETLGRHTGDGEAGAAAGGESEIPPFYTTRHRHIVSEDGHMIIAGVAGAESIQRCEDEPIHIPGAIQSFGCLIAVREKEDGSLDVRVASENTTEIIGYSPHELFERENMLSILSDEQVENLMDHLEFVRDDTDPRTDGPEVFSLVVTGPGAKQIKLWCAIHSPEGNLDLFICEFELEEDYRYPLHPTSDEPSSPEDTLSSTPTHEELEESTMSTSRPLRVLRHSRKPRGDAAAMGIFSLMGQIQEQLASATDLGSFLKVVVGLVKEVTGFHRVMIYQFDEAWNGRVVTELVDPRATKDLYKGLNFPASDIPAQARALYRINKVRLLYDRDQSTARLVCKTREDLDRPVDLTHCEHIFAGDESNTPEIPWEYGSSGKHEHFYNSVRSIVGPRLMSQLWDEGDANIERLSYARRLHARKLINTVPTEQNPSGFIVASSNDLLELFDADCGLLSIRDETKVLGKLDNSQEALVVLEYLRMRNFTTVITSQDLVEDFPDLKYKPGFKTIAGLLLVPLSSGGDFIVFIRKPVIKHVHWGGNPYDKKMKERTAGVLEPRTSFKIWSETVVGKSREWTEEQIETAAVLCLVYGKFIEVWRQKEAALKSSQLTRLLLANASHEVRTPLNAIINYLEIALEGPLDKETRDNLARSHSASKSLIYVINDLLDLTRTEEGQDLIKDEIFDLRHVIKEATDMFKLDTERKGLSFETIEYPGLPPLVKGDPARLRQVVSNVIANAVKHTSKGGLKVEVWTGSIIDGKCDIEIAIEDTGVGISPNKLDILFGEFEQVHTEDDADLGGAQEESASFNALSKIPGKKVLGLGLAVVARAIRNMRGQLRLRSEEGKGSRFTLCVPFTLPTGQMSPNEPGIPKTGAANPSPTKGEITLIQPPTPTRLLSRQSSMEGLRIAGSGQIGSMTVEIDRIVDAISSPSLSATPPTPTEYFAARPSSAVLPPSRLPVSAGASSAGVAAKTYGTPIFERLDPGPNTPGREFLTGSVAPLRPVRLNYDGIPVPSGAAVPLPPPVMPDPPVAEAVNNKFTILVAEDDPINSKIIKKRLERMGHEVQVTANGEECFEKFREACGEYDAVLMDMQMPIMDGGTSATRIRNFELKQKYPSRDVTNGRIPIFAVSASLFEERRTEYLGFGFDGWILKPIDFRRLIQLLEGTRDLQTRRDSEYVPGQWERGGWFLGGPIPEEGGDEAETAETVTDGSA